MCVVGLVHAHAHRYTHQYIYVPYYLVRVEADVIRVCMQENIYLLFLAIYTCACNHMLNLRLLFESVV
jgi:hypothetical protein